ncbi:MAG: hypothetical protein ACR2NN_05690 [Bryobacteraceae bacterium]
MRGVRARGGEEHQFSYDDLGDILDVRACSAECRERWTAKADAANARLSARLAKRDALGNCCLRCIDLTDFRTGVRAAVSSRTSTATARSDSGMRTTPPYSSRWYMWYIMMREAPLQGRAAGTSGGVLAALTVCPGT